MTLELIATERRALRARAHALKPVVMVSNAGLSAAVLREIDRNLTSRELIKIRALTATREAREELLAGICAALDAAPVQHIGKILVIYRPRPEQDEAHRENPTIRRRPARRTKRSFQR